MAEDEETRTEDPTAYRLGEERKKGHVARSAEVDIAFYLLTFLIVIGLGGGLIVKVLKLMFVYALENMNIGVTMLSTQNLYLRYSLYFWLIMFPIGFLFILSGFISMIMQVGWLVTWKNLEWKFDIINFDGLKKIFSIAGLKKLAIDLIKLAVLFFICWIVVRKSVYNMLGLVNLDIVNIYIYLAKLIVKILFSLLLFYIFFATADYFWSKFNFMKDLKMTKQEVKDEFKQLEGDPNVKRKIISLMLEESMKRMMKEVPTADVVITNPTHLAIAIKYDKEISDAPLVVAKGKRLVAEKIKELARQHDIPIVEDKPLARLLYKHSSVGKPIDVQFYAAVAEILANIYNMKNKTFS